MQEMGEPNEVNEGYDFGMRMKGNGMIIFKRLSADHTWIYVYNNSITSRR